MKLKLNGAGLLDLLYRDEGVSPKARCNRMHY
jgi:hypothetical protein